MKITKLSLRNIRVYESAEIELSPKINLIVGENNSGKSTIIKSLLFLQDRSCFTTQEIRKPKDYASISLSFSEIKFFKPEIAKIINLANHQFECVIGNGKITLNKKEISSDPFIPDTEPGNFIYTFLSKRKVGKFSEEIGRKVVNKISGNFSNIFGKVDRISGDLFPAKGEYIKACREILGFRISPYPSSDESGKIAVYIINNFDYIPLESMGEGVANLLGLILDLCMAENKLFLIEEPENDIHPKALKKLLDLVIRKSENNQFVITTHSNIVLKYLGAAESTKIFKVGMKFVEKIPTSEIVEVNNSPEARRDILNELGYELFDFDLWDAWLILEESSAETIIKEFLIPRFAPRLEGRIKTCSASGVDKVPARVEALHSLCLFLHLQKSFGDKIWVLADAGDNESKIIAQLKAKYSWGEDRFLQFGKHNFEEYYPKEFKDEVDRILNISSKEEKRKEKKSLLEKVKSWYKEQPEQAARSFEESAGDVIEILKQIEKSVCHGR